MKREIKNVLVYNECDHLNVVELRILSEQIDCIPSIIMRTSANLTAFYLSLSSYRG